MNMAILIFDTKEARMIFTIAKMILVFFLLAVLIIIISVVVWAVKEINRWVRKERRKRR